MLENDSREVVAGVAMSVAGYTRGHLLTNSEEATSD